MPATRRNRKRGGTKRMRGGGNIAPYLTTILKSLNYSPNAINAGVTAGLQVETQMKGATILNRNFGQQIIDISTAAIKAAKDAANIVKQREKKSKLLQISNIARDAAGTATAKALARVAAKEAANQAIKKTRNTRKELLNKRQKTRNETNVLRRTMRNSTKRLAELKKKRNQFSFTKLLRRSSPLDSEINTLQQTINGLQRDINAKELSIADESDAIYRKTNFINERGPTIGFNENAYKRYKNGQKQLVTVGPHQNPELNNFNRSTLIALHLPPGNNQNGSPSQAPKNSVGNPYGSPKRRSFNNSGFY